MGGVNEIMFKVAAMFAEKRDDPTVWGKGGQKWVAIFEVEFTAALKEMVHFQRFDGFYAIDTGAPGKKADVSKMA